MSLDTATTKSIIQTIQVMRRQEENGYQVIDYLSDLSLPPSAVDASCRYAMIQWANQVATLCGYQSETIFITINVLDRFLSTTIGQQEVLVDRDQFQLAFMSALYTCVKINEPVVLDLQTVSAFSQGLHTLEAVTAMEMKILNSIGWKVNPPSPHSFVRMIFDLLLSNDNSNYNIDQHEIEIVATQTLNQIESIIGNYRFLTTDALDIALACVLNVLEDIVGDNDYKLYLELESMIGKVLMIDTESFYFQDLRFTIIREIDPPSSKNHNKEQNSNIKKKIQTASRTTGNSSHPNKGNDNNKHIQRSPRTVIV